MKEQRWELAWLFTERLAVNRRHSDKFQGCWEATADSQEKLLSTGFE